MLKTYSLKLEMHAAYAFVERMIHITRRHLAWEIVDLNYVIMNALIIGLIGVSANQPERVLYLIIGAVVWSFLSIIFSKISESISWERWEGTIEYTMMAPIHITTHMLGNCLSAIVYGLFRTIIVLLAVSLFLNINLSNANLPAAFIVLMVSSISFMGLGLMCGILPMLSPEKGIQGTFILQGFILLISGVYYDISVLPHWLQPLAALSPATYTLQAMRMALLQGMGVAQLKTHLLILFVLGIILLPVGYLFYRLGEHYARYNGKLSRNG